MINKAPYIKMLAITIRILASNMLMTLCLFTFKRFKYKWILIGSKLILISTVRFWFYCIFISAVLFNIELFVKLVVIVITVSCSVWMGFNCVVVGWNNSCSIITTWRRFYFDRWVLTEQCWRTATPRWFSCFCWCLLCPPSTSASWSACSSPEVIAPSVLHFSVFAVFNACRSLRRILCNAGVCFYSTHTQGCLISEQSVLWHQQRPVMRKWRKR